MISVEPQPKQTVSINRKEASDLLTSSAATISCCNSTLDLVIESLDHPEGDIRLASILHLVKNSLDAINSDLSAFDTNNL